jgi:hypothetical protein
MGMGAKLAFLGAAGAATLAVVGAAGMAYNYFMDPELGSQRRKTTMDLANSMLEKTGLAGMDKHLMQTLMEKLAGR